MKPFFHSPFPKLFLYFSAIALLASLITLGLQSFSIVENDNMEIEIPNSAIDSYVISEPYENKPVGSYCCDAEEVMVAWGAYCVSGAAICVPNDCPAGSSWCSASSG